MLDLLAGPSLNPIGVAWALVAMVGAASYFVLGSEGIAAVPAVGLAGCGLVAATASLGVLGAIGVLPLRAATASRALRRGARGRGGCRCSRSVRSPAASPTAPASPGSGGSARAWRRSSGCWRSSPASSGRGCCSPRCRAPLQLVGGLLLLAGIVVVRLGERPIAGRLRRPGCRERSGSCAAAPRRSRGRAAPSSPPRCARARPPGPRGAAARRAAECQVTDTSALARASGSGAVSSPLSPCSMSDVGPPSPTAITGSPLACASRMTWPKVSVRLANRNASALA